MTAEGGTLQMVKKATNRVRAYCRRVRRIFNRGDRPMSVTIRVEIDEDDGGFVASLVELPGIASQGDTEVDAVRNVIDAFMCVLDTQVEEAQRVPHAGKPHEHRVLIPA